MSKLSRSEQARINGARSKGPISIDGKAKSSLNSCKHGLTAKTVTLINENKDEVATLISEYNDTFRPANQVEMDLITDMACARVRTRRALAMETAMLDLQMSTTAQEFEAEILGHDEDLRKATAFTALSNDKSLTNVSLYQARLERTYHRSLKTLLMLQERRKNEPEPDGDPLPVDPIDQKPPTYISAPASEVRARLKEKIRSASLEIAPIRTEKTNEPNEPVNPSIDTPAPIDLNPEVPV